MDYKTLKLGTNQFVCFQSDLVSNMQHVKCIQSCRWEEYADKSIIIPSHTIVARCYDFILVYMSIGPSVCPYFHFRMIAWVNVNEFSPNLIYALIVWGSGLGLQMGKFWQFLTEIFACDMSLFSFLDDNLSKCQWISPNLVCALILWRSCLGLLMGFHQFLRESSVGNMMTGYYPFTFLCFPWKHMLHHS